DASPHRLRRLLRRGQRHRARRRAAPRCRRDGRRRRGGDRRPARRRVARPRRHVGLRRAHGGGPPERGRPPGGRPARRPRR
ncbi:MAG: hypothetical protein AVDCRST_MAG85-3600, partial [uncultured Solirubrobacteraceae bacterium]